MALTYTPPGVSVSEVVGRNARSTLATPTTLCLVGRASGSIVGREQLVLQDGDDDNNPATANAPVPIALTRLPEDSTLNAVTEVRDAFSGTVYLPGTDYVADLNDKTITRVSTGPIADGTVVRVGYSYTPANYFDATRFESLQAVEERFGSAWTTDGAAIGSPLSHSALVAFQNGAPFVVLQPLYVLAGSTRTTPTDAQTALASTWATTLEGLQIYEDINLAVPVVGEVDIADTTSGDIATSNLRLIWDEFQRFLWFMKTQEQRVLTVFGHDSANGVNVSSTDIINSALALQNVYDGDLAEATILVSPSKLIRPTAAPNQTMYVGGQWAAIAVAGQIAGRRVQTSLTRKPLAGFTQVAERRTKTEKNEEAGSGVLVIEQRGAQVQIRHGITIDTSSIARSEISIVRSKQFLIESVYGTLESSIIGTVVANNQAPVLVRGAVLGVLERVRSLGVIASYGNIDARLLENDPTTVEVRFDFQPFFPINNIQVVFSVDFQTGDITNVLPGAGR